MLVLLAGAAACASGGAVGSQGLTLLVAALAAAGLGGWMSSGCTQRRSPDPVTPLACGEGSLPPGSDGTEGWFRCCIGYQTRVCPPPPPLTACNYGWGETFCPNGSCGLTASDPCRTGAPDASDAETPDATTDSIGDSAADVATDAGADAADDAATPTDAMADSTPDAFLGCGVGSRPADAGVPDGWLQCCMAGQTRWCPPHPAFVACNYGIDQFCADGITCGPRFQNPCGDLDSGTAEALP